MKEELKNGNLKDPPPKVSFAILWIILFSLIGFSTSVLFLGAGQMISTGSAVLSLVYLIFAICMAKKEKWAWVGAFIYPILLFLLFAFFDPFFSILNGLIILLILLFPLIIAKKEYDSVAENKFTIYKSIFFWLLIVIIVITSIYVYHLQEEQKFAQRCHGGRLLSNMHFLRALLERDTIEGMENLEYREAEFNRIVDFFEECNVNPVIHIKDDKYCASIELWWERNKDLFYCIDYTLFAGETDANICSSETLKCY